MEETAEDISNAAGTRTAEKELKVGIIGCGMVARYHANAIRRNRYITLVGACSKSLSSAEKFCTEFPEAKLYQDYEKMLEDKGIDAVAVCSPSGNHYAQARQALEAGKHVIIEKPLCLDLKDADCLIGLAKRKNLEICCISQSRFSDAARTIKAAVEDGSLGKVVNFSLMMRYMRTQAYYDQADWRGTYAYDGGGVLMNQGVHSIDLLCYFLGKPKSVMGYAKTVLRNIEVEDTGAAALEFENGAIGVIDATVCSNPSFVKKFIICGENGTIILEDDAIKLWSLPTPCPLELGKSVNGSSASDPKGISFEYHTREYRNIAEHFALGTPLLLDGQQGRLPLSVILGIYESSKTGKRVML